MMCVYTIFLPWGTIKYLVLVRVTPSIKFASYANILTSKSFSCTK